jgi:very-short-patch-repair endonuclease
MSDPQEIFLRMRERYPETTEEIKAKKHAKMMEDDAHRRMLISRHQYEVTRLANLKKAQEARRIKPKTKDEGQDNGEQ